MNGMSEYFQELKSSRARVKVKFDWSNYGTKADLKNTTGVTHQNLLKRLI